MPKYTYTCECGFSLTLDKREEPICEKCSRKMERKFSSPQTILKGASESNQYYVPPTNADLGLPSEYEVAKQSTKKASKYLETEDQEMKRDHDAQKAVSEKKRKESIAKLKVKYPKWMNNFEKGLDKSTKKQRSKRETQ